MPFPRVERSLLGTDQFGLGSFQGRLLEENGDDYFLVEETEECEWDAKVPDECKEDKRLVVPIVRKVLVGACHE